MAVDIVDQGAIAKGVSEAVVEFEAVVPDEAADAEFPCPREVALVDVDLLCHKSFAVFTARLSITLLT